jgi:macrolide transport system ATP-binding/permease protein
MKLWFWPLHRREIEDDLQAEIRTHLEMAARDRVAEGAPPESARLAAMKDFGNVLQTTEATRRVWRGHWIESVTDLWQDVRFGVRILIKNRGFSLVVIAVLTLGIGGNAAVFSLFNALALKPIPGVEGSSGMGVVVSRMGSGRQISLSYPDYRYFRDHDRSFTGLAATDMVPFSLGLGSSGERVWGEMVSGNYFQVLGVGAQIGRTLLPTDDVAPGKHPVAVLGDGLWRRAFGADPNVVGRTIQLNGQPITVVGVARREFRGTIVSLVTELFVPVMMQPQLLPPDRLEERGARMFIVLGHLRPGIDRAAATTQLQVLSTQLDADRPVGGTTYRAHVLPMWQSPYGAQTYMLPVILAMMGMGVLVLLVVSANVANLVLVRGLARRGELAVRLALGASRHRILRLLLVENLLLAIPGALAGVALAGILLPWLPAGAAAAAAPTRVYLDTSPDGFVLGFSLLLSVMSALAFGFVPALRTSRVNLVTVMSEDTPSRAGSRTRLRSMLVVSQVAVSMVLLVGAGLVLRTLSAARNADAGFDSTDVSSVAIELHSNGYDEQKGRVFFQSLLDSIGSESGVEGVALASSLPLTLVDGPVRGVVIEGYSSRSDDDLAFLHNIVTPGYFQTLRIPLVAGRDFERRDDPASARVAIVNETLARRMWETPEGALGRRIKMAGGDWRTIVGVARDLKYARLTEEPRPYVYLPFLQTYTPAVTIHVRAVVAPTALLGQVARHIRAADPNLPILSSRMLTEQIRVALSPYEMAAGTLVMFGMMTIVLAALGIYGLVAYTVQLSTQEIGVRLAVGARRVDVVRRFLRHGVGLAAFGTILGLGVAIAAALLLRGVLFGVSPIDGIAFIGATSVVIAIALAASFFPAWRASRTDPLTALRRN